VPDMFRRSCAKFSPFMRQISPFSDSCRRPKLFFA
jgi:hypothetical protein